jgi:hypothetical protein
MITKNTATKKHRPRGLLGFLKTKQLEFKDEPALWALVAGADRFVRRMADLARALSKKPSYGLFYAY